MPDYRQLAKYRLDRAEIEIASGDPYRLRYAALELREAMECITYDKVHSLKSFLSDQDVSKWQPTKLVDVLDDVNPYFDQKVSVSIGKEDIPGLPAKEMQFLGTDTPLKRQTIKKYYHALGHFLHVPTISKLAEGKERDLIKLRNLCDELLQVLREVLASPIFNIFFGKEIEFICLFNGCGNTIRKRIHDLQPELQARCIRCGGHHTLKFVDSEMFEIVTAEGIGAQCACCQAINAFPAQPLSLETPWKCAKCGSENRFVLNVAACTTKIDDKSRNGL